MLIPIGPKRQLGTAVDYAYTMFNQVSPSIMEFIMWDQVKRRQDKVLYFRHGLSVVLQTWTSCVCYIQAHCCYSVFALPTFNKRHYRAVFLLNQPLQQTLSVWVPGL